MAEVYITKSGQRLVLDKGIATDAAGLAAFLKKMQKSAPSEEELAGLLSAYPAFFVSSDEETVAFLYSRGHGSDLIEIVDFVMLSEFAEKDLSKKLLALFEERAKSWKNVIAFQRKDDLQQEELLGSTGYRQILQTKNTSFWHKDLSR